MHTGRKAQFSSCSLKTSLGLGWQCKQASMHFQKPIPKSSLQHHLSSLSGFHRLGSHLQTLLAAASVPRRCDRCTEATHQHANRQATQQLLQSRLPLTRAFACSAIYSSPHPKACRSQSNQNEIMIVIGRLLRSGSHLPLS